MPAAEGSEGDLMAVAEFCLEQAQRAMALAPGLPGKADTGHGLSDFDRVEFYVLKLDHVYQACCELNKNWPPPFGKPVRNAAKSFVQLWNGSTADQLCNSCAEYEDFDGPGREEQAECESCQSSKERCGSCGNEVCRAHARYRFGADLRNALAHYEGLLADPHHRLRGAPSGYSTVRGTQRPFWVKLHAGNSKSGPQTFRLFGKTYQLSEVYEALVTLHAELSAVLVDPETGQLRQEA